MHVNYTKKLTKSALAFHSINENEDTFKKQLVNQYNEIAKIIK